MSTFERFEFALRLDKSPYQIKHLFLISIITHRKERIANVTSESPLMLLQKSTKASVKILLTYDDRGTLHFFLDEISFLNIYLQCRIEGSYAFAE